MKTLEVLARACLESAPADAAHALDSQDPTEAAAAIGSLPIKATAPVMDRLSPVVCAAILQELPRERAWQLLDAMAPLEAAAVLPHLSDQVRAEVLLGLPEQKLKRLHELSRYSKSQAGGIMDPNVVAIPDDLTVKQAIALMRKAPRHALYYLYVVDRSRTLKGVVSMREILLARSNTKIATITNHEVTSVPADMAQRDVVSFMRTRRFLALPVVDVEGRLIGVVKHDQAVKAVHGHAYEDLQRMFGAGGQERANSPAHVVMQKRLPWLMVNLATVFVAAALLNLFVETVKELVQLAVLLPVVLGQAHATGSQTLAVVMRGLATHEIAPGRGRGVITKEVVSGLLNGFAVATAAAGVVLLWQWDHPRFAIVIFLAMLANTAAAAGAAAAVPFVLRHLGRDPAQASSIAMTTITDLFGIAAFLSLAVALL